jgi:proline racemase
MEMCGHVTVAVFASMLDDALVAAAPGQYQMTIAAGEIALI